MSALSGAVTDVTHDGVLADGTDSLDWDAYASHIARTSEQHIARLISAIKSQQREIEQLRARLQATLALAASAPPTTHTACAEAAAAPHPVASAGPACSQPQPVPSAQLHNTAVDGEDACSHDAGGKRSREEVEQTDTSGPCGRSKRSRPSADDVDDTSGTQTADAAAAESADSEPLTQSLPTLVVNILPPSPVKATNTATAQPTPYQPPPHSADTQPIEHEHDTRLPQHQQAQVQTDPTAADRLFDELTEQEAADATTRRKRLEAQSLARTAFDAMKRQHYTTAHTLLTQSLALLPPAAYPPSFLRARLTCAAKLGRQGDAAQDAELLWRVRPASVSAFMRGVVECRGRSYGVAVAWLREAEWRKRDEERAERERGAGLVDAGDAEDVWDVTAEEREMRVVSLQAIRDNLSKVEQRMASELKVKAAKQQADGKQQPQQPKQQWVAGGVEHEAKDAPHGQPEVTVVDEKGKGGKRVTFVAPHVQQSLAVPSVT